MTVQEAVGLLDAVQPNAFSLEQKILWLSQLDGEVFQNDFCSHQGTAGAFGGYDAATPPDTVLLVPAPFDRMYPQWLASRVDFANQEFARFNNSNAAFQAEYRAFANWFNRTHAPKGERLRFF